MARSIAPQNSVPCRSEPRTRARGSLHT